MWRWDKPEKQIGTVTFSVAGKGKGTQPPLCTCNWGCKWHHSVQSKIPTAPGGYRRGTKKAYPPCADGPYKKTLTHELRSVKLKIQRESTPIKKIVNRKKWILRSIHLCLWWKSRKNEHNKRSDSRTIGWGENGAGCEGSKINVVDGIRKYCKETKKAMAELKRVLQSGKQNGQYGQLIHCCAGPVYEKF